VPFRNVVVFLFLVAGLIASGVVWLWVAGGPGRAPIRAGPASGDSAGAVGADTQAILAELSAMRRSVDELVRRLDARAAAGTGEGADAGAPEGRATGSPGADSIATDAAHRTLLQPSSIDRLTQAIDELRRVLLVSGTEGKPTLTTVSRSKTEIDWEAWRPVILEYRRDEPSAVRSLQLLTRREVLARFGPPTRIWDGNNWVYFRNFVSDDDPGQDSISLIFEDDHLVYVGIEGFEDVR